MNAERLPWPAYIRSRIGMMARGEFSWASLWVRWRHRVAIGAAIAGTAAVVVACWSMVLAFAAGSAVTLAALLAAGRYLPGD